jgi:GTPase SAR1 family protein
VKDWIELCRLSKKDKTVMILVGNKLDLEPRREVKAQEAQEFANIHNMRYFEASAKTNHNINQIFVYASETYINLAFTEEVTIGNLDNIHHNYVKQIQAKALPPNGSIELNSKPTGGSSHKKPGGCC